MNPFESHFGADANGFLVMAPAALCKCWVYHHCRKFGVRYLREDVLYGSTVRREQLWLWRLIDVSQVEKFLICVICKVVTSHHHQRFRRISFASFSSSFVRSFRAIKFHTGKSLFNTSQPAIKLLNRCAIHIRVKNQINERALDDDRIQSFCSRTWNMVDCLL